MKMRIKSKEQLKQYLGKNYPSILLVGDMLEYAGHVFSVVGKYKTPDDSMTYYKYEGWNWRADWVTPTNKITVNLHRGRKW